MTSIKVLHVIPSVSKVHGGPTHALAMMERSLSARGVAVTTATTDDDGPGRRLSGDVIKHSTINGARRQYARKISEFYKISPGLFVWLMRHCAEHDVVHIHALFSFSSVAAALAAKARGVPYIVRPLGTLNEYGVKHRRPWLKRLSFQLIESWILRKAAAVHFTSKAEWEEAKALGVAMRGVVIPIGVEGPIETGACILPFPISTGQAVVLFLSRLDPKKNLEGLLGAAALLRQSHSNFVLVIAGEGTAEYTQKLQKLAEELGVADLTIWTGHLDGVAKTAAIAAANVFVLPSLSENFGIAAVEALIAGVPCVIGRGVAIADDIVSAGAGIAADPDPASIAGAIDSLLGDQARCRDMGAHARSLAIREYSSAMMANRLENIYMKISSRRLEELHG